MTLGTAARSPAIQRGAVAILAALAVLIWPDLFGSLLLFLVGAVAVAVAVVELIGWRTTRDSGQLFQGLVLLGAGLAILLAGDRLTRLLELAVAGVIAARAARSIYSAYRSWKLSGDDPFWASARGVLAFALAGAIAFVPETLLKLGIVVVAIAWIVGGVVVLINTIGEESEDGEIPADLVGVLKSKSMAADLRSRVTDTIFEGWDSHEGTIRFAALMSFATAIATFGIKADSTAVVIGAMLIAPLMSPIMALSASILMGWPKRAGLSAWRVALGVAIGVGGSFLMSLISPEFVEIGANSQILSRVAPTILDLLVALAAGAAGGYAVTHPQVSNSLPGVAIAVALAPPLAVVGVSLDEGSLAFAGGAFLLFLTNLVGIVVASGVTYILSGYSPLSHLERSGEQGRRSLVLVGIALVLVAFPLALIGDNIVDAATAKVEAEETVLDWLGPDSGFSIARVTVIDEDVTVIVVGSGMAPDAEELASEMADALGRAVTLDLRVIPEQRYEIDASPGG